MDRKPGPFDTVGISGREYNRLTDENAALRARAARLEEALRESRDFIMSSPTAGDEVAIVNKMSRALEEK